MKLVYNRTHRGFRLSVDAFKRLISLGSSLVEVHDPKVYYGETWEWKYKEDLAKATDAGDGYLVDRTLSGPMLHKDGKVYTYSSDLDLRSDPALVAVVEQMGPAAASGEGADLAVFDGPGDFEVQTRALGSGMEMIREKKGAGS